MTRKKLEGIAYAGFFHPNRKLLDIIVDDPAVTWTPRELQQLMERHVCVSLAEGMEQAALGALREIRSSENDPPDCLATLDGQHIGIEVTELVSSDARRTAGSPLPSKGPLVLPEDHALEPHELVQRLATILAKKDKPSAGGAPLYVLVFTDEMLLTDEACRAALDGIEFGPFDHVIGGWLLLSYDPAYHGYPVIPLRIHAGRRPAALV